jgi:hypothetical protein
MLSVPFLRWLRSWLNPTGPWSLECSFFACQTVHYPNSATRWEVRCPAVFIVIVFGRFMDGFAGKSAIVRQDTAWATTGAGETISQGARLWRTHAADDVTITQRGSGCIDTVQSVRHDPLRFRDRGSLDASLACPADGVLCKGL